MPKLDWLTRSEDEKVSAHVPYRLLEAVPEHSYGDPNAENMLIQGDNLDALKALLPFYAGPAKFALLEIPRCVPVRAKRWPERGWGWPGFTAHVHCLAGVDRTEGRWGWPGFTAHVHYHQHAQHHESCWGWPGFTAHVHYDLFRSSSYIRWGWPGFTAHVH